MKNLFKLSTLLILLVFATSCVFGGVKGDGNVVKEKKSIESNFSIVKVSQGIDVYLEQSNNVSFEAEMDKNILELLDVIVENNTLKISFKKNVGRRTKSNIYLKMPNITEFNVSSGAQIHSVNELNVKTIKLSASSGAELELNLLAETIHADASSGSDIDLKGKSKNLYLSASSGSDIDTEHLFAEIVKADASSGSDIKTSASVSLSAEASSGGDIKCYGKPKETHIDKSSGGSVDIY